MAGVSWHVLFDIRWVGQEGVNMSFDESVSVANLLRCFRDSLIGRNVKGIVHNMNSPLQVLSMHMELLAMDLGRLSTLMDKPDEMTSGISQAVKRIEQLEDIVSKINDMVRLLGIRAHDEEQEKEDGPVMVSQMLMETIEFWKADLFFKHKVGIELSFPEASPVLVLNEHHVRDGLDGIFFYLIGLLRNAQEPGLEISISGAKDGTVSVGFFPKGALIPIEKMQRVSSISNERDLAEDFHSLIVEPETLSMALAKTSLEKAGAELKVAEDGLVVKLKNSS